MVRNAPSTIGQVFPSKTICASSVRTMRSTNTVLALANSSAAVGGGCVVEHALAFVAPTTTSAAERLRLRNIAVPPNCQVSGADLQSRYPGNSQDTSG